MQMVELLQWSEEQMLTARTGVLREKKEMFGFWVHLGGREDWWVCDEGQRNIRVLKNNRVIILNSLDLCFWERLSFL